MSEPVKSLGEYPNWGGGFPGPHEFSTLSGLKPDEDNFGFDDFSESSERLVANWAGNQFVGLYIYGTPGNGKTHATIGLGRMLADDGANVTYVFGPAEKSHTSLTVPSGWMNEQITENLNSITRPEASVFSRRVSTGVTRNPRSVLIFDDVTPENQKQVLAATQAAAEYGGLIIATSNIDDPMSLLEVNTPKKELDRIAMEAVLEREAPEEIEQLRKDEAEAAQAVSDSLRSRIASGFRFINFTGEDRRPSTSFWAS